MHGLHLEKLEKRAMTNDIKSLLLHIEEELEGQNTDLMLEHDEESIGFNLYDNYTDDNKVRLHHTFTTNKSIYTVEEESLDDGDYDNTAVIYTNNNSDYIVVTDNYLDIPLLYVPDINYMVVPDHDLSQIHMEDINNFSMCLTTIDDFAENNPEVTIKVIQLDNSTFNTNTTPSSSLFEMAVASEKEGLNGVDAINKYIHSAYKSVSAVENNTFKADDVMSQVIPNRESLSVAASVVPDEITATVKSKTVSIKLKELIADDKYQLRVTEDALAIKDLASAYQDGDSVPAIEVVDTGGKYIIVDGFHRFAAATEAGLDSIECSVTVGTERDAFIMSLGANAENKALKRTNPDKRKSVTTALKCPELRSKSHREIANICKVSPGLVDKVVQELKLQNSASSEDGAYIGTKDKTEETPVKLTDSENSAYIGSDNTGSSKTSTKASQDISEKISNDLVSLSVNVKSPSNEIALNNLIADLRAMIDEYVSELEEVE